MRDEKYKQQEAKRRDRIQALWDERNAKKAEVKRLEAERRAEEARKAEEARLAEEAKRRDRIQALKKRKKSRSETS